MQFIKKEINLNDIPKIQKMELINKSNKYLINDYKNWLSNLILNNVKDKYDFAYYIDKILFVLGKTIKNKP